MLICGLDKTDIDKKIEQFETKYNFTFPPQYRSFLLKYNGGETPNTDFEGQKVSSDITGFFGIDNGDEYLSYSFFENINKLEKYFKRNVIPIGKNIFGDDIVIGLGTKSFGKVYMIFHDMPWRLRKVSDDFIAFTKMCTSEPIGHIPSVWERTFKMILRGNISRVRGMKSIWKDEIKHLSSLKRKQEELVLD